MNKTISCFKQFVLGVGEHFATLRFIFNRTFETVLPGNAFLFDVRNIKHGSSDVCARAAPVLGLRPRFIHSLNVFNTTLFFNHILFTQ